MGKSPNGAFGATNGKIGNLVSYKLRGQDVTRIAGQSTKERSLLQLARSQRLTVVNEFLKPIKGLINIGFKFEAQGSTKHQYNIATSYNMINAIKGEYPFLSMDYSKAKVSSGKLEPVSNLTADIDEEVLRLAWSYDKKTEFEVRNDRAIVLLVFADKINPIYLLSGSLRSEGSQIIEVGKETLNQPFHLYLSFLAEDRDSVSDSKYLYVTESKG
jgi:hypothetical protein